MGVTPLPPRPASIARSIEAARSWLLARQNAEGFWCAELEGDTTLESYLILVDAFLSRLPRRDSGPGAPHRSEALARVIREEALAGGGWAQYPGGPPELSVSVLSYFALKIAGDPAEAPHMLRSRDVIRRLGGAARANTYTKYHLALFGQYPWSEVPAIPPEMVFLPGGGPFNIQDMSSWSRTIFVPLSILYAMKVVSPLPAASGVPELFTGVDGDGPASAGRATSAEGATVADRAWKKLFSGVDRALKVAERFPGAAALRRLAIQRASAWMIERFDASDGLSAILPAMACSVMALKVLGYAPEHPLFAAQLGYLDGLLLADATAGSLRMQPCLSPVWDTVLASHALVQTGLLPDHPALRRAASWLLGKQTTRNGDWSQRNPAAPGGWYFEHRNEFYPDVDDTCMALMVLRHTRADAPAATQDAAVRRGLQWMLGM